MNMKAFIRTFTMVALVLMVTVSAASAASAEEKRHSIRTMTDKTLGKLYGIHPSSRAAVESAAGYAVFSITDAKIVFLGGGGGKGMAVNNSTGEETFMKVGNVQVGFGLGIKKFEVVFVFETDEALAEFTEKDNGWSVGGQGTLAATDSVNGASFEGAVSAGKNVWMYQMTDKGLEISLTVRGIRYYKDSDLN